MGSVKLRTWLAGLWLSLACVGASGLAAGPWLLASGAAPWLAASLLAVTPVTARAQQILPVPALTGRVVDRTGTLNDAQRAALDAKLAAIEQRKGAQVVVLIVPTTAPEPIEDFSIRVAEAWKIGRGKVDGKSVDDGVILLVAKNDRRVRIEVGYGLEGAIPDALASRIISETIAPRFREGDFAGGLSAAVDDLGRLIDGESLPAPWQGRQPGAAQGTAPMDWLGLGVMVLVGGLVATAIFGRVLGSLVGGVGAGVLAGTFGLPLLVAAGVGVAAFVFLLVFAASGGGMGPPGRGGPGGPVIMLPPGGGWGRRGGGGGGGGFSGGGGGFGGGGASGNW